MHPSSVRKLLLLGDTGKMGTAMATVFSQCEIVGVNSARLDAGDFSEVSRWVESVRPDAVVNAIAHHGVDACEKDPDRSFRINALLPMHLARLSAQHRFLFVHFSSEAVFGGALQRPLVESDRPSPVNFFGYGKSSADFLIPLYTDRYYIFRLPVIFGPSRRKHGQLVESMVDRLLRGERGLKVADDIVTSPSYTLDLANAARAIIEEKRAAGLYHLANSGETSLFTLVETIAKELGVKAELQRVSYRDLPHQAPKSTRTPLGSEKIAPLRPWTLALSDYLRTFPQKGRS